MPIPFGFTGALLLGIFIGWQVYYINRYRTGGVQLSDLTTLVSVIGTASATLFFTKAGGDNTLFSGFCIGLFLGFFGYLLFLIILVLRSNNFDLDWFLDGRRKVLPPDMYIPDQTGATIRPAIYASSDAYLPAASNFDGLSPHAASFRPPPSDARIGDVDPGKLIVLMIVLKPKAPVDAARYSLGRHLTRDEYLRVHGTDQRIMSGVVRYARKNGLLVTLADPAHHTVILSGTYGQAQKAFRPDALGVFAARSGHTYVARSGHIWVPEDFRDNVVAVMGFDERRAAVPYLRAFAIDDEDEHPSPSFPPAQIGTQYRFPTHATGKGRKIGLIELGGGYDDKQMSDAFVQRGVVRGGRLQAVVLAGSSRQTGQDSKGDAEVQLDIQIAGSIAPDADILVFFALNKPANFLQAVQSAIDANVDVISISWGWAETNWSPQDMDSFCGAFAHAADLGITVCVASGDYGAIDNSPNGLATADFPASSPNVLGCGGTSFASGDEEAWDGSGGGYSGHFPRPSFQAAGGNPNRGVPDVAGDADPAYDVSVNGVPTRLGGTSAVAPLWAGLIALCCERVGKRVGLINPLLYATNGVTNDITEGSNGGYFADTGWDPVTGLGSPIGTAILQALGGS